MSKEPCNVNGCGKDRWARGLCGTHYAAWRQGRLEIEAPVLRQKGRSICTFEGCDREVNGQGLCDAHYQQLRMGVALRPIRVTREARGCIVPGCDNKHDARGLCSTHYSEAVGNGTIPSGARKRRPNSEGYIIVFAPGHPNAQKNGYLAEHTLVMSAMLGRPLLPDENVHHINGIKDDNRPENLELWIRRGAQPAGQRVADMVTWAKELLGRYEPAALA